MIPMETKREGDKITKVVVEDFYKVINRVYEGMNKAYNKSSELLDSVHKEYDYNGEIFEGELIIGTGVSKPCAEDTFDEEIGNEIAFRKAKLNANYKKASILMQIWKNYLDALAVIDADLSKVEALIQKDLDGIREYNPEYLK